MTDKELLEAAARANWRQELADEEVTLRYSEQDDGMLYLHADNQDHNGLDREFRWNPLEEDHDALRLAVKLGIDFYEGEDDGPAAYAGYFVGTRQRFAIVPHDGDPYAATRRAIVRAAAAIGSPVAEGK